MYVPPGAAWMLMNVKAEKNLFLYLAVRERDIWEVEEDNKPPVWDLARKKNHISHNWYQWDRPVLLDWVTIGQKYQ